MLLILVVVGIVLCVSLFVVAYVRPRRSRTLQGRVEGTLDRAAGTSGLVERPAHLLRKAVDASASAGRGARRERESTH